MTMQPLQKSGSNEHMQALLVSRNDAGQPSGQYEPGIDELLANQMQIEGFQTGSDYWQGRVQQNDLMLKLAKVVAVSHAFTGFFGTVVGMGRIPLGEALLPLQAMRHAEDRTAKKVLSVAIGLCCFKEVLRLQGYSDLVDNLNTAEFALASGYWAYKALRA